MSTQFDKLASEFLTVQKARNSKQGRRAEKIATSSDGRKVMEMMGSTENLKAAMERAIPKPCKA